MDVSRSGSRLLARHRRAGWNRAVAKVCRTYLNGFDNLDYDGATNGEAALLGRMSTAPGAAMLDVGANKGSWTGAVRARHPAVVVHAFEIDPDIAAGLAERFADDPSVVVVAVLPCVRLVRVTATPGNAPPWASCTMPETEALVVCAAVVVGSVANIRPVSTLAHSARSPRSRDMEPPWASKKCDAK